MAVAPQRFATTRWSMVLSAANRGTPDARRALDELCAAYWYPLYAFVRRQGHAPHAAEDLTQGFFTQFIQRDCLASVRPDKGRFRTFLLVCLRHYLANVREAQLAAKRGGGRKMLSIDLQQAEARYRLEPVDHRTPELNFQRNWALAVLEAALARLHDEFAARNRQHIFAALKIYLTGDQLAPPYADVARDLDMSETAVKVAVHRLRERYREAVEEQITQTLDPAADPRILDEELTDLLQALSSPSHASPAHATPALSSPGGTP